MTGGASVFEVVYVLSALNFSLFQKISLTEPQKTFVSLCLFFGLSSAILGMAGAYILRKCYSNKNDPIDTATTIFDFLALFTPKTFGFNHKSIFLVGTFIGMAMLSSAAFGLTIPPKKPLKHRTFTSFEVATVAMFSALYAVMIVFTYQVYPV